LISRPLQHMLIQHNRGLSMDVETKIADLASRVSALEMTAKNQERHNARATEILTELKEDVALLRRHAISTGQKVEEIDARLGCLETRLGALEARVERIDERLTGIEIYLKRDLPGIIADTMREVLREGK
jgi:hypothetical protein